MSANEKRVAGGAKSIEVTVLGRSYTVACDDGEREALMKAVAYLGVTTHLEDLVKGVIDLKDVVFYLSVITFGLFLAHQSVESQRWRA